MACDILLGLTNKNGGEYSVVVAKAMLEESI